MVSPDTKKSTVERAARPIFGQIEVGHVTRVIGLRMNNKLIEFVLCIGEIRKLDRQHKTQLVCDIGSMLNMSLITTGTVDELGAYSLWNRPMQLSDAYLCFG